MMKKCSPPRRGIKCCACCTDVHSGVQSPATRIAARYVGTPAPDHSKLLRDPPPTVDAVHQALGQDLYRQDDTGFYAVLAVRKDELSAALTEAVHRTMLNRVTYFRVPLPQPIPAWLVPVQPYLAPDGLVPGFAFVQMERVEVQSRIAANGGSVTVAGQGVVGYALLDENLAAGAAAGDVPTLPLTGATSARIEITLPIAVIRELGEVTVGNPLAATGLLYPGFPTTFSRAVEFDRVTIETSDHQGVAILPSIELLGNHIVIADDDCPENAYCINPSSLTGLKAQLAGLIGGILENVTASLNGKQLLSTLFGAGFDRAYFDDSTNEWQILAFRSTDLDAGRRSTELARPGETFAFHMSPSAFIATAEFYLGTGEIQNQAMHCYVVRSEAGNVERYESCAFYQDGNPAPVEDGPFQGEARERVGTVASIYPAEIADSPGPLDDFEVHEPDVQWTESGLGIRIDFPITGAAEFEATLSFLAEPAFTPDGRLDFQVQVVEFDLDGVWDNAYVQAVARRLIAVLGLGAITASFIGIGGVSPGVGPQLLDIAFSDWEQYVESLTQRELAATLPPKAVALPTLEGDVVEMIRGEFTRLEFGTAHGVTLVVGLDLASRTVATDDAQLVVARGDGILAPLVVQTNAGVLTLTQEVTAPLRRGSPQFNGTNLVGAFEVYIPGPDSAFEPCAPMEEILSWREDAIRAEFDAHLLVPAPTEFGFLDLVACQNPRSGSQEFQILFLRGPTGEFSAACVGGVRIGQDLPRPRAETEVAARAAVAVESFQRWIDEMRGNSVHWLVTTADPFGETVALAPDFHGQTLAWWRRAARSVWKNSTPAGPKMNYLQPAAYADEVSSLWENEDPDGEGRQRSIHGRNLEMMLQVAVEMFSDVPLIDLDSPLAGYFEGLLRSVANGRLSESVDEYFDEDWDDFNETLPPGYWELPRPEFVLRSLQPDNRGVLSLRVTAAPTHLNTVVSESQLIGGEVWSTHTESRVLRYDLNIVFTVGGIVDPATRVEYSVTTQRFGEDEVDVVSDALIPALENFSNPKLAGGAPAMQFTRYTLLPVTHSLDFSAIVDRGIRDVCVTATLLDAWGNELTAQACIQVESYIVEDKLTSAAYGALSGVLEVAALDISLGAANGSSGASDPVPGNPSVDPPDGETPRIARFRDPLAALRARIRADLERRARLVGRPLPPVPQI